jgi:UDP-N-acetylglucosamine 1-carboxyvinyltransferase
LFFGSGDTHYILPETQREEGLDKILVRGGNKLKGKISVSGAKNAALPALAATLLTEDECRIINLPGVRDVATILRLISDLGGVVSESKEGRVTVNNKNISSFEAPYELVRTMRASILVLGPLLAKWGRARVSLPGGCAIGARPINLHLKGLQQLGAQIDLHQGYVEAQASRLKGARIWLDIPTVTGTENLITAACLAQGETVIENAACEPEIIDLADMLNKMGAKIEGVGTDCIHIQGVDSLSGCEHEIMSDRIEAGTFMIAAAITGSCIEIDNCNPGHLSTVIAKLREAGVKIDENPQGVKVASTNRLQAVDIKTAPYPGFPTDMQAQFMALMSLAQGTSVIAETVFENRFMHVLELLRMGADIKIEGHTAVVNGVSGLSGAPVMATDLRASASLVLAALAAEGETKVSRIYHLDRGYEHIEQKLSSLGADIQRIAK